MNAKCLYCGEEIEPGSKRCPHCGSILRSTVDSFNTYANKMNENEYRPLSNGTKVFFTVICTIIPGFGQLVGIIMSIIYMNTHESVQGYSDRRSFGLALLIASIIMFLLYFIIFIILILAASMAISY